MEPTPSARPSAAETAGHRPPIPATLGPGEAAASPVAPAGYEILAELGRGGMGVVYKARQIRLGRFVALKMLLAGAHAGPGELARFQREAEALARLQHPHIVHVHEVGEHQGHPFFSLELVSGGSLDKRLRGRPLPPAEAAGLTEALARAVQAAHDSGVLHRDLKPANVLLTADGVPKITDFGLAKRLDGSAGQTASGAILGTPSYMPPEQAYGEGKRVGPAADVYALGAILYELLTGRPPFVGVEAIDTLLQVTTQDPVAPSRLNGKVPRDLETICLKCLEKEPGKRYASAAALAEDLRRFRAGEPITARPVGRLGRLVRWARRRPAVAALWAVGLAAVIVGCAVWLWQVQARAAQEAVAAAALEQARGVADRLRPATGEGLPTDPAVWSTAWAAARRAETLAEAGGDEETRRGLRALLDEMDALERDRRMARRLEEIRLDQASPGKNQFNIAGAEPAYAKAFRDYGTDPDTLLVAEAADRLRGRPIREQLAAALDNWAMLRQDRPGGDPAAWRRLLMLAGAIDPNPTSRRLRDALVRGDAPAWKALAAGNPADRLPAPTLVLLGQTLKRNGDLAGTVRLLRLAQRRYPADFWINRDLGHALLAMDPPAPAEAICYYTAALAVRPDSPGAYLNLGLALQQKGDLNESNACYREALRLKKDFAKVHNNLANNLMDQGDAAAALAHIEEALRLDRNFHLAHCTLGMYRLRFQNDPAGAVAAFRQGLRLQKDSARAHYFLGVALAAAGDTEAALASYREAVHLQKKFPEAHYQIGLVLKARGRLDEAAASFREAIRTGRNFIDAQVRLAILLDRQGRPREADPLFAEVMRLQNNNPDALVRLGATLYPMARLPRVLDCYRAALHINPDHANALYNLGHGIQEEGRLAEALAAMKRGHELGSRGKGWFPSAAAHVKQAERLVAVEGRLAAALAGRAVTLAEGLDLALLCRMKGRYQAAVMFYEKAFAHRPALADDRRNGFRVSAALCAAQAGCGQGSDGAGVDEKGRARLRNQALAWLRAELALAEKTIKGGPPAEAAQARGVLQNWQTNVRLDGLRDPELARLPEAEQPAWRQFWADVERVLRPTPRKPSN